jgi:hypothetical protein
MISENLSICLSVKPFRAAATSAAFAASANTFTSFFSNKTSAFNSFSSAVSLSVSVLAVIPLPHSMFERTCFPSVFVKRSPAKI